jgi:hypothetical protein
MPRLLKKIKGGVISPISGNVKCCVLTGEVGMGDYFSICGMTAFLQDFSNVYYFETYTPRLTYGLNHPNNNITEIKISY